jgi:hypothetical protein
LLFPTYFDRSKLIYFQVASPLAGKKRPSPPIDKPVGDRSSSPVRKKIKKDSIEAKVSNGVMNMKEGDLSGKSDIPTTTVSPVNWNMYQLY